MVPITAAAALLTMSGSSLLVWGPAAARDSLKVGMGQLMAGASGWDLQALLLTQADGRDETSHDQSGGCKGACEEALRWQHIWS